MSFNVHIIVVKVLVPGMLGLLEKFSKCISTEFVARLEAKVNVNPQTKIINSKKRNSVNEVQEINEHQYKVH
jgi:hypothetical protein